MALFTSNGSVALFHDNSKKFETTNTGAKVTGDLEVTGVLTYDDVTNVDSIGIITARSGIHVTGGSINANGDLDVDGHTELDSLNVTGISTFFNITAQSGIITATTFDGNSTTSTIATFTSEWNITANGSSDYRFTGSGFDGTENDPTIYLTRGEKYKFTNNMGAHPFQIRTAINGSAYNDGITNNGISNGTLTWDVQMDRS